MEEIKLNIEEASMFLPQAVIAEEQRIANEENRKSAEATRITNEQTRQTNEAARIEDYSEFKTTYTNAIQGLYEEIAYNSFDSVAAMKACTRLEAGATVQTLGYYSVNDGGAATYKIRTKTSSDVQDNGSIHFIGSNLVAELIIDNIYNILQFGVKKDGSSDCSQIVQNVLENVMKENTLLYFPDGVYLFNTEIDMTNCIRRNIKGDFNMNYIDTLNSKLLFNNCSGFINCKTNEFTNLLITGANETHQNTGFGGARMKIHNCNISFFEYGIYGKGIFTNNTINRCNIAITGCVDSRIINNTINANESNAINLYNGCNDNTITNNKIEWNKGAGIASYQNTNNVISNNTIDRNSNSGISFNNCTRSVISNNMLRRNCADASITGSNSHNIKIENCSHLSICGNVTNYGKQNDDQTGVDVPEYGLYLVYSNNLIFSGNDFSGGVTGSVSKFNTGENIMELNLGDNLLEGEKLDVKSASWSNNVINLQFNAETPGNGSFPKVTKFGIYYRKTDKSVGGYKEITANIFYNWSNKYVVNLSDTTLIDNIMTLSATFSDGKITLTINTTNTNYAIKVIQIYTPQI